MILEFETASQRRCLFKNSNLGSELVTFFFYCINVRRKDYKVRLGIELILNLRQHSRIKLGSGRRKLGVLTRVYGLTRGKRFVQGHYQTSRLLQGLFPARKLNFANRYSDSQRFSGDNASRVGIIIFEL
jgi:hypothetical protein